MWLNYSSNLANSHLSGLTSECGIDGRVEVGGRFYLFYDICTFGSLEDKMHGMNVGVILFSRPHLCKINSKCN